MTEGEGVGGEGGEVSPQLEEERLLSVLTHGSTGRNPTFFKAAGHEDVFGLKADIPAGGQALDGAPEGQAQAEGEQNVLYVQLPEGHPVITKSSEEEEEAGAEAETLASATMTTTTTTAELSVEEAIEQAEFVFDDIGITEDTSAAAAVCQGGNLCLRICNSTSIKKKQSLRRCFDE